MAGDWIKMRAGLLTHPKVIGIVKFLEADAGFGDFACGHSNDPERRVTDCVTRTALRYVTVGGLLALWSAARMHSNEGFLSGIHLNDLDDMAGIPAFGRALESVGWAVVSDEPKGVTLPDFGEWNDQSHKGEPRSNAERQKAWRDRQKLSQGSTVTKSNDRNDREEESREEESRRVEERKEAADAASPAVENQTADSATAANVVLSEWNLLGKPFAQVRSTPDRRKALAARLRDPWWSEHWREGLARIRGSPFCRGETDSGTWVADIDWFLKPKSLTSIIEGKYDPRDAKPTPRNGSAPSRAAAREAANANAFAVLQAAADAQRSAGGSGQPEDAGAAPAAALCDEEHSGIHRLRP
jgi:hypothetical protein